MKTFDELTVKRAVFSDTTAEYVTPAEPSEGDQVTVRLRVLKGSVAGVDLVADSGVINMKPASHKGSFEYYEAGFTMKDTTFIYYFEIKLKDDTVLIYDGRGLTDATEDQYKFRLIPGFHTPDWARGAIFYQIYVDRFNNGDETNDVLDGEYRYIDRLVYKTKWGEPVAKDGIGQFYGGDLKGVMDKLDYLKDLGVDVIYFNPIFVSASNHKYDIADYDHVDPHFGRIVSDNGELLSERSRSNSKATRFVDRVANQKNLDASNELFAELVRAAHERGMKVILDGVFNHCGSFNKWLDAEKIYDKAEGYEKGAYIAENSPYHDYFIFKEGGSWPNNKSYEAWWDYDTLPKLNYACKELYDYMLGIAAKWVSEPYCCDGWRLDVAADLGTDPEMNHRFWTDFRKAVKTANPDAIVLAEHYGDPSSWLQGDQWDTVMNYDAFMEPLTWFTTGMEKHSDEYKPELKSNTEEFWKMMRANSAKLTTPSLQVAMNELSNHDHSRFLTRTNSTVGRIDKGPEAAVQGTSKAIMREAVAVQMTWPGAPTVYYGDEVSLPGFTDPDNRRCYPWGNEDLDMLNYHKAIIAAHKSLPEMKAGSLIPLPTANGLIAYARRSGKDATLVVINNYEVDVETRIPTWMIGLATRTKSTIRISSSEDGWSTKSKTYREKKGYTKVKVGPHGVVVLKVNKASLI